MFSLLRVPQYRQGEGAPRLTVGFRECEPDALFGRNRRQCYTVRFFTDIFGADPLVIETVGGVTASQAARGLLQEVCRLTRSFGAREIS